MIQTNLKFCKHNLYVRGLNNVHFHSFNTSYPTFILFFAVCYWLLGLLWFDIVCLYVCICLCYMFVFALFCLIVVRGSFLATWLRPCCSRTTTLMPPLASIVVHHLYFFSSTTFLLHFLLPGSP